MIVGLAALALAALSYYHPFWQQPQAPPQFEALKISEYGSRAIAAYKGTPVFEVISAPSGRTNLKGEGADDHVIVNFESCTGTKEECDRFSESAQRNLDQLRVLLLQGINSSATPTVTVTTAPTPTTTPAATANSTVVPTATPTVTVTTTPTPTATATSSSSSGNYVLQGVGTGG